MKTNFNQNSSKTLAIATAMATLALLSSFDLKASSVTLQNATADFSQVNIGGNWLVGASIDGSFGDPGWAVAESYGVPHTAVYETQSNVGYAGGTRLLFSLYQLHNSGWANHGIGRFRLSVTSDDRSLFGDGLHTGGDITANWTVLTPQQFTSSGGSTLTLLGDNSILATGVNPATDIYTVLAETMQTQITGIRLEALPDSSMVSGGPGRSVFGNFVLTEFQVDVAPVPEPGSLGLFVIGLLALIGRRSIK